MKTLYEFSTNDYALSIFPNPIVKNVYEVAQQLLPPNDLTYLHSGQSKKRLDEQVSSRIAALECSKKLDISYQGIIKNEIGKPLLLDNTSFVSISHSTSFAGALVHKFKPCALDIEKIREKTLLVQSKYLLEHQFCESIEAATLAWAIKEVGYKMYPHKGISLIQDIDFIVHSNEGNTGFGDVIVKGIKHPFYYFKLSNYIVVHTI
jgi:4'-phosphopantetheinyl transferase EntD